MNLSIYWTFIDDAGPTHRDPILRGVIRVIGSSSIVPYESLVDLLRVNQRVEERSHSSRARSLVCTSEALTLRYIQKFKQITELQSSALL